MARSPRMIPITNLPVFSTLNTFFSILFFSFLVKFFVTCSWIVVRNHPYLGWNEKENLASAQIRSQESNGIVMQVIKTRSFFKIASKVQSLCWDKSFNPRNNENKNSVVRIKTSHLKKPFSFIFFFWILTSGSWIPKTEFMAKGCLLIQTMT